MRNAGMKLGLVALTLSALGVRVAAGENDWSRLSFQPADPGATSAVVPIPDSEQSTAPPPTFSKPQLAGIGEDPSHPDPYSPTWTVQVEPMLWFVGPSGKFKLPVTSGTGPGSFTTEGDKLRVNDLDLASTRIRPAGTLTIASGAWRFAFTGTEYDLSRSDFVADSAGRLGAVAFGAGDHLSLDMSFGTYEATAGYRVWGYDFKARTAHPETAVDAVLILHVLGGIRLYDVDIAAESASTPARSEGSHLFVEPMVGVRAEAIIDSQFSIVLQLTAGGLPLYSTSSLSFDIVAAFQWHPTPNIGVQIGWRQLAFDLKDGRDLDEFRYTGRLAGLFTGVVIRF